MHLSELTGGKRSTSGTVRCEGRVMGAVLLMCNGEDEVTCKVYDDTNIVLDLLTKNSCFIAAPFAIPSQKIVWTISGTGGYVQIYEWKE